MPGSLAVRARSMMKALRKTQAGRGLVLEMVPVPQVGPTDVLVRVKAASICGTDLHVYGWDAWSERRVKPPVTLRHEFCGTVEHVGEEVTEFGRGERQRGDAPRLRALPPVPARTCASSGSTGTARSQNS